MSAVRKCITQRYANPIEVDPATADFTDTLVAFNAIIRSFDADVEAHPLCKLRASVFLASTLDASLRKELSQLPNNDTRWFYLVGQFLELWDAWASDRDE